MTNATLDEGQVIALMQSVNAVRVVLGTMLDVGEDDEIGAGDVGDELEAERQLYGFLSWLLDWIVRSLRAHLNRPLVAVQNSISRSPTSTTH